MSRPAVRPGRTIKEVLTAGPATAAEIHRAYREAIRVENGARPRKDWLRAMTYGSFRTFISRAKDSGLIRVIGSKPMEKTPNPLVGIRGMRVIEPQVQTVYQITEDGIEETLAWENLQAYAAGIEIAPRRAPRRPGGRGRRVAAPKKAAAPIKAAPPKRIPSKKSKVAPAKFDTTSAGAKIAQRLKQAAAPAAQKATKKATPKMKQKKG